MHDEQAESDKPDQDLPGDGPKMSSDPSTSTSTSSQTPEVSGSPHENGNGFGKTPATQDGNLDSSSSFLARASSFTSPNLDDPEMEHEITLTLHMSVFGRRKHVDKMVADTLRDLHVRGNHIIAADLNGKEVTEAYPDSRGRFFYDNKFNGFFPGIDD